MDSIHRRLAAALSCSALLLPAAILAGTPAVANGGVAPLPNCSSTFSGGAGTVSNPYLMSTVQDLTDLNGCDNFWGNSFLQTANIDMNGATWSTTTTGTDPASGTAFSGTYDGGSFTISDLNIRVSANAGLFGYVTGSIRNVQFVGTSSVYASNYAGGLVGYLDGGTVSNSSSEANVEADNSWAGGLVAYAAPGSVIESSHATGSVEADDDNALAGGLVGENKGAVTDSHAMGAVEGKDRIGGLIGANYGSVIRSYATGNVLGYNGEAAGGLIGENSGTVAYSYAEGNVGNAVTNGADIGGLIGLQEDGAVVTTSYATGNVTGFNSVGGLVGRTTSGSTVSRSYATGAVTRPGSSGDKTVGGFVGENDGSISDSYATGDVNGGDAGGFAGENDGSIANSYSIGAVSGDNVGGLIWTGTGSVSNSFWDTVTSGQASSDGGTGKTTAEMKTLETFTNAGWSITESCDATTTWGLCSTRNSGYPYLTFYTAPPTPSDTFVQFTFWLPDGRECTSISPMQVRSGSQYRLPDGDALCQTMPGSKVIGWTIPVPAGFTGAGSKSLPFSPGHLVDASNSQQFTAVIWEPVIEFRYDANVGAGVTCEPGEATHTSNNGHIAHIWVPREDFTDARFPTTAPCTPPGHELQAWNTTGNGTGQTYTPGNPLPETWATDEVNTHWIYAVWRPATAT